MDADHLTENGIIGGSDGIANCINSTECGKRKNEIENTVVHMDAQVSNSVGESLAKITKNMKFKKMKLEQRTKKMRTLKPPVWSENTFPTQLLYDLKPSLEFTFDVETKETCKAKYICKVNVHLGVNDEKSSLVEVTGDGLSKKDAKRKCAFFALCQLYPDSYRPSHEVINSYQQDYTIKKRDVKEEAAVVVTDSHSKLLDRTMKRMKKFLNKPSVQVKTPTQLLYELCPELAETGQLVSETGAILEQKFTYEFRNVLVNATSLTQSDSHLLVAYGFGRSKKDAKQHAGKQALKQFLNCDVDKNVSTS